MKKAIIGGLLSLVFSSVALADDGAKLHIKMSGDIKNTYFLCVSHVGCVNAYAGAKGYIFPMDAGKVEHVFLANSSNLRMYPQPLPSSCQVDVKSNQTLVIKGQVSKAANDNVFISHLSCSVA